MPYIFMSCIYFRTQFLKRTNENANKINNDDILLKFRHFAMKIIFSLIYLDIKSNSYNQ